jgi:hypothetical protein
MPVKTPDPRETARQRAEQLRSIGYDIVERGLERIFNDAPWLNPHRALVLREVEAFHRERMARTPSAARFPEAAPWIDYVVQAELELQKLLNLTPRQVALMASVGDYLTFRGYARIGAMQAAPSAPPAPPTAEKCRVLFCPETDHGALHIKNVDDPPPPNWKPDRTRPATFYYEANLFWDGVGSGLHIDDEPEEIFPLPILQMYRHYADDVPGAVQFLTRYSQFHGGGNFVLRDRQMRSVAIEKCSRNFIEIFAPDPVSGFTHVSGMACRNPQSPQGRYQQAKRDAYRRLFNLPADGTDATFWNACSRAESMLADGVKAMGRVPARDAIFKLFTTPWPEGLNKCGAKLHPAQWTGEYTWITHAALLTERKYYRWQRDEQYLYPAEPEIFQY